MKSRGCALVSDDDEFFRVAIRSVLLDRNGFSEVIESATFVEAVEQIARHGIVEIALFDLNMPGMDNWVDLGSFRARFPDTRLVVVSGSRRREDILRALSIGANGFIHKGAGVIELSRAIKTICDGHVYVPAFLPEHPGEEIGLFETSDHSAGAAPFPDLDTRANHGLAPTGFEGLACTARQREVILLLISGHSNKSMARVLGLSEGTIKFHMSAVLRLLGVASRVEAATRAMKLLNRTTD